MRKITACVLFLSLSFIGCSTVTTVGGVRDFHYPVQREGGEMEIRITSGSSVEKEVVSVDQDTVLPVKTSLESSVSNEISIPETVVIVLIISSIVRDAINSIPISMGNII